MIASELVGCGQPEERIIGAVWGKQLEDFPALCAVKNMNAVSKILL